MSVLAHRVISLPRNNSVAIGAIADIDFGWSQQPDLCVHAPSYFLGSKYRKSGGG
jgi:hypothetical protein